MVSVGKRSKMGKNKPCQRATLTGFGYISESNRNPNFSLAFFAAHFVEISNRNYGYASKFRLISNKNR